MSSEPVYDSDDEAKELLDASSYQRMTAAPDFYSQDKKALSKTKATILGFVLLLLLFFAASSNNIHKTPPSSSNAIPDEDLVLERLDPRYVDQIRAPPPQWSFFDYLLRGKWKKPDPPLLPQPFAFEAVFGDNMVLQHGSKAAVYGFLGPNCTGVKVVVLMDDKLVYSSSDALINATQQPFGEGWGVRPCPKEACPPYDMKPFNPWNAPLPTWKILLPPQSPGGNYTIQAQCISPNSDPLSSDPTATISITNITFGDVWYCSGQSNMWLPLSKTFHRNETAKAILSGNYKNLYLMAGLSMHHPHGDKKWEPENYGSAGGTNPWMNSRQAVNENNLESSPLFNFGAACWYFAQKLADQGVDIPIGLANTAIGGQRIQEFMDNRTIHQCQNRTKAGVPAEKNMLYWEGELFGTQVLPFADMTLKGFVWYQGENNMFDVKGNSAAGIGYGCEMKRLIQDWRRLWSQTPHTTDAEAPFGIVTLASSGNEGGPDMGAMRMAQTANYGVLPHEGDLPNTFLAQAYDLDDEWGPEGGLCFEMKCCEAQKQHYDPTVCTNQTLFDLCHTPTGACTAASGTPEFMGGIHPRSKKYVGDRLGIAAYNLFYGGKEAFTGPTIQGCSLEGSEILEIRFNKTLLRGDSIMEPAIPPPYIKPDRYHRPAGGSQLYVQTNASQFCMESKIYFDGAGTKEPRFICPAWAGGTRDQAKAPVDQPYTDGWIQLNFTLAPGTTNAIHVDLATLGGVKPTAVRYGWDLVDCCDYTDPNLYVTHNCIANCPLQSAKSKLPANPFQARILHGRCECVPPQLCSD